LFSVLLVGLFATAFPLQEVESGSSPDTFLVFSGTVTEVKKGEPADLDILAGAISAGDSVTIHVSYLQAAAGSTPTGTFFTTAPGTQYPLSCNIQ